MYFNIIPEHTHTCVPSWYEFPNYVECGSPCLYLQLLTNSQFHFPVTVEWRPPNSCFTGPKMMNQNFPETAAKNHVSNVHTFVFHCGAQELHHKPYLLRPLNPLKPELNPICYLLALLGAHNFLHVSRIRVKLLTLR